VVPSGAPEDELAAKYKAKADEVEAAGFHRFAVTMSSLAETYGREAERIRKEHNCEEEAEEDTEAQQSPPGDSLKAAPEE
jgi:cobalamin-dependent methionine synthase I